MQVTTPVFKKILNLAICVFGIQFATALQLANMTSLYKFLGASSSHLSYLWLAAPISGLFIQPLVGQLSDSTSSCFGKRIPYIFVWGILASAALLLMPYASGVAMATLLLWMLDCSINGCTETLRALTADLMANPLKSIAFAVQTVFAGIGAGIAAILPWVLEEKFQLGMAMIGAYKIPLSIRLAFIIGGIVLLICIIYVITAIEEKPFKRQNLLKREKQLRKAKRYNSLMLYFKELKFNVYHMPKIIKQFYIIQIFTWIGLFSLWLYFSLAITQTYFNLPVGAAINHHLYYQKLLEKGTEWAGFYFGIYQFVSVIYAMILPKFVEKTSAKFVHGLSLVLGALGIVFIGLYPSHQYVIISAIGMGLMWGSIMTLPYAIITAELPKTKMGVYLGIFNITITLPQILSGLFLGFITTDLFHGHALYTLVGGGIFILLGGILMLAHSDDYNPFLLLKKTITHRLVLP